MATNTGAFLTKDEERTLLQIARNAMKDCVTHGVLRDLGGYGLTPALRERHGVFITLRCAGHLRGRAGAVSCEKPLAEALQAFAVQATLHDDEYRPIAPNETDDIDVEISVLCPRADSGASLIAVTEPSAIALGRDGVYLERSDASAVAVALPQEVKAHHWDGMRCLSELCRKAGVDAGAWKSGAARVYRFEAEVFSERHHSDYANW